MRVLVLALVAAAALSQQWQYEHRNIMTIALGIACPTDRTCYLGGTQDGVGNIVLVTQNGGETYEEAELGEGGRPPAQMMLMSTAAQSATSAVTVGMGVGNNAVFTENGRVFDKGAEFTLIGVSQNVKTIPGTRLGYGMAGQFVMGNDANIATSLDGGRTWRTFALPAGLLGASSRYIHFVDQNTWIVSGGSWPRRSPSAAPVADELHEINEMFAVNKKTGAVSVGNFNETFSKSSTREGYVASIVKTTNGGATWERIFYEADQGYYFNQIDCPSASTCYVSGEGRGSARIVKTDDGGRSWRIVWQQANNHNLMGLRFLSPTEGWACGMKITAGSFSTMFLHTTNGGARWEEHLVGQAMCSDMSFASRTNAHATAIEPLSGQSSTLVFR